MVLTIAGILARVMTNSPGDGRERIIVGQCQPCGPDVSIADLPNPLCNTAINRAHAHTRRRRRGIIRHGASPCSRQPGFGIGVRPQRRGLVVHRSLFLDFIANMPEGLTAGRNVLFFFRRRGFLDHLTHGFHVGFIKGRHKSAK